MRAKRHSVPASTNLIWLDNQIKLDESIFCCEQNEIEIIFGKSEHTAAKPILVQCKKPTDQ